jgi:hypothetical protein
MMSSKGFGPSGRSLILRFYPDIRREGLRNATKKLSQDIGSTSRDLNPRPPKNEAEELGKYL